MNENYTRNLIKHDEGVRYTMYKDSLGIPTIGVGFNLTRDDAPGLITALGVNYDALLDGDVSLTDQQVNALLDGDIATALAAARKLFSNFDSLDDDRQAVLVNMAFNMGQERLAGFQHMIAAVEQGDFVGAAAQMKDSAWAKQVGNRAVRLEGSMKTGGPIPLSATAFA
jgi:GH24 family phage-related lysozyme (muramidase)